MERLSAHEEMQELLGAYALDAVEPDEAAAIERHLPTCPRCRSELTDHREVAALLGYAGATAPSGVWDRIVASLEEPPPALNLTRALTPVASPTSSQVDIDALAAGWGPNTPPPIHARAPDGSAPIAPVVPIERARRRRSVPMRIMVAMASAAAIIVAVAGVEVGRLQVRKNSPIVSPQSIARLAYQSADANPANTHLTLTSADGVHTVRAVMVPDGVTYLGPGTLDMLASDQTYQMWGLVDGARVSLAVIGTNPTYAAFNTPKVKDLVLAMTVEKSGGVVSSTNPPVVTGLVNA